MLFFVLFILLLGKNQFILLQQSIGKKKTGMVFAIALPPNYSKVISNGRQWDSSPRQPESYNYESTMEKLVLVEMLLRFALQNIIHVDRSLNDKLDRIVRSNLKDIYNKINDINNKIMQLNQTGDKRGSDGKHVRASSVCQTLVIITFLTALFYFWPNVIFV